MTRRRSRLPGNTSLILVALAAVACGGDEKKSAGPAGEHKKIEITPTADARADAPDLPRPALPQAGWR